MKGSWSIGLSGWISSDAVSCALNLHKGISFLEENYSIIHALDFNDAVDSVAMFRMNSKPERQYSREWGRSVETGKVA